jgi:DNA-binding beta-propeller fold protein YncE
MTVLRVTVACALSGAAVGCGAGGSAGPADRAARDLRLQVADATVAVVGRVGRTSVRQSGTVVDARRGLVATTAHTLWGARSVRLDTTLGTLYGRVVSLAPCDDVALLQTQPVLPGLGGLDAAAARTVGPGERLQVFGFHWTATPRPVRRLLDQEVRMLRADTAVRVGAGIPVLRAAMEHDGAPAPDLTGGPVVDAQRRMVGLATIGAGARNAAVDGARVAALLGGAEPAGGRGDEQRCRRQLDAWAAGHRPGFVRADVRLDAPVAPARHATAPPPPGADVRRQAVVRRVRVGHVPTDVAVAGGTVWLTTAGNDRLIALDARTGRPRSGGRRTGANPLRVAATGRSLWTANAADGTVTRLDPRRPGEPGSTVAIGADAVDVAAGPDATWVTNGSAGTVTRLAPGSGEVLGRVAVGRYPTAIAVGPQDVWVVDSGEGTVVRVDPRGNRVVGRPVRVGRDPRDVVLAAGLVWVANAGDGTVSVLSARTGRPVRRPIRVGGAPTALAGAGGRVLVLDATGRISGIDAPSGRLRRLGGVRGTPGAIAAWGGDIWMTDARTGDVLRLKG